MNRFVKSVLALSLIAIVAQTHCSKTTTVLKKGAKYAWLFTKIAATGATSYCGINVLDAHLERYESAYNEKLKQEIKTESIDIGLLTFVNMGILGQSLYELYQQIRKDVQECRKKAA